MHINLWYFNRGDFCKHMEIPFGIELPQRVHLQFWSPNSESGLTVVNWVFVKVTDIDYEYSHVEKV